MREAKPVPIVGDAAIATQLVGDGRLVVLLILDASERADLAEFIRIHEHLPPGDVTCRWGSIKNDSRVALVLSFTRPAELTAIIEFDVVKQGCLVEQILQSEGLYIQSGRPGDRLVTTPENPRIFMEIPDTGFRPFWDRIFLKHLTKHFRRDGFNRLEAKAKAKAGIAEWRKFGQFRI